MLLSFVEEALCEALPVVVCVAVTAVLMYTPSKSANSETHCKIELWPKIFSHAFPINSSKCSTVWELLHRIPGNGAAGSLSSDFMAIVEGPVRVPVFLVEFEVGGLGVHKDDVCLISEALFEIYDYLSHVEYGLEKLADICFYVGYISDGKLTVNEIHPQFDLAANVVYFRDFESVAKFDLLEGDTDDRINETLRLLRFIKTVLIPNGTRLHGHLGEGNIHTFSEFLPNLPKKGIKSSDRKGAPFTPFKNQEKM
ncbi:hypothetical protein HDU81_000229 [Chytriomyces hyalinus]|nr:hypothetical protein HDU81_000229 [Chytriomyces hyalinus]